MRCFALIKGIMQNTYLDKISNNGVHQGIVIKAQKLVWSNELLEKLLILVSISNLIKSALTSG